MTQIRAEPTLPRLKTSNSVTTKTRPILVPSAPPTWQRAPATPSATMLISIVTDFKLRAQVWPPRSIIPLLISTNDDTFVHQHLPVLELQTPQPTLLASGLLPLLGTVNVQLLPRLGTLKIQLLPLFGTVKIQLLPLLGTLKIQPFPLLGTVKIQLLFPLLGTLKIQHPPWSGTLKIHQRS